ncbi:MAG: hypothetical protein NTV86_18410 [Planctomycetota bacterium]|nr:hypothetical protein [Planctomycetota bacterium]
MNRTTWVLGLAAAVLVVSAPAFADVVPISGYIPINDTVGAGNTGQLVGETTTAWWSQGFSVPLDLNGNTLIVDSGGGNMPFSVAAPVTGSGTVSFQSVVWWSYGNDNFETVSASIAATATTNIVFGRVLLANTTGPAILGNINVGTNTSQSARLTWGASNQFSPTSAITVLTTTLTGTEWPGGSEGDPPVPVYPDPTHYLNFLDLAGYSDTVAALTLGTNVQVRTGTGGVLTTSSLIVGGVPLGAGTYTSSNSAFVTGSGSVVVGAGWPGYLDGDFNLDGEVGPEDFGILKDGFGLDGLPFGQHQSWTLGDANDDGEIGPEDFGMLKDNFGLDGGPTGTYPLTNVPEPMSLLALLGVGLPMLLKRRANA